MIKLLKRFVEFLETRFPAKVVVTQEVYNDVVTVIAWQKKRIESMEAQAQSSREDIASLQESVRAIKELISTGGSPVLRAPSDILRNAFVRGDFNRSEIAK